MRICRQKNYKEMNVSYEILFAGAQSQLFVAKLSRDWGTLGIKKFIFFSQLADFLLNINTPSRASERFFKQISFHARFTFQRHIKG